MMYQFPIKKKMHIVIAHIVIARIVIAHIVIAHIVIAHLPSFDVPHGHQVPTNPKFISIIHICLRATIWTYKTSIF